jgi:superfamily I DNA/RNA helicase
MSERLILGPPGCGKTHRLINIVKEQIQDGVNPERIAFVSFSKKSIEEARLRSSMELELPHDKVPWFRTLHSIGFRWLGMKTEEIVNRYDFNKIGIQLGMVFDNGTAAAMTDGLLPVSAKEGNKYLELIGRAKLRKISLEEQYNDSGNYNINWPMLVKVDEIYAKYKSDNMKYDFTDMISLFVQQGTAPSLDVLIVDEAQDLTPLQWDQVDV